MPQKLSEKETSELAFWQSRLERQGTLANDHFEYFYTTQFGLDREFYAGKKILDIGCGPRGSLEWATEAKLRVGADPLAEEYKTLGIEKHSMRYVACGAEKLPFPDGYFNVVCSFNSLDHVDNLELAISEISRVVAPEGRFLLITDIHSTPTVLEPNAFRWDIVDRFLPRLEVVTKRHIEQSVFGDEGFADIYKSLKIGIPFSHDDPKERNGILAAQFEKRAKSAYELLYEAAKSVVKPRKISEVAEAGGVGAALLAENGKTYTGVCIDTSCSMGFCAEHAAAAAMVTAGESRVLKMVAVGSDGRIMPPCGRCREFISQLHDDNMKTEVIIAHNTILTLEELLPHSWLAKPEWR